MLPPDPQFVHFDKVGEDEIDRVLDIALWALLFSHGEVVASLPTQIVPQEQAANRMLNSTTHFHHVFHNLLDRGIFDGHIDRSDGDHEVEARDDVSSILDEFVKVGEVVDRVGVAQVVGEVSQGVKDGHVEFIVLFGAEGGCSQLGNQGRSVLVDAVSECRQKE